MRFFENESANSGNQRQWIHWLFMFAAVTLAGVLLIPFLRSQPESVHNFVGGLANWQGVAFVFGLCVAFTALLFRLFSPRISHLRYLHTHPPIWLAWAVAIAVLCAVDLTIGLSLGRYAASIWEWLGYAGGSIVLVVLYVRLTTPAPESPGKKEEKPSTDASATPTNWPSLEAWLRADEPAKHDFLGNRAVAERLKGLLTNDTRSIGIVGPFGAGKTTIIKWIVEMVENEQTRNPPSLLFSQHSCWGFESSASAIHAMLADGIERVAEYIDTFQVGSLPESYRQMFSAGGEWLDKVSRVVFRQHNPIQQFRTLSALLQTMGSRLVFIVEDLDRNDSRSFDIQDVLAFLQQLKNFSNLSFVLTGGRNAPKRIDFAKLCDRFESLKEISIQDSATLVCCFRERCLDSTAFPHEVLTPSDDNQWRHEEWISHICPDVIQPPEAIARLLNTPRSLRHALDRTYRAWQRLAGEIDWDHLLAVNVLYCAASEAWSFVWRHWNRLNDQPSNESYKEREVKAVQNTLKQEWEEIVPGVDWDVKAVRALIDLILPATPAWLDDNRQSNAPRLQGVHQERYWQRVLNEAIGPNEISDQAVARDFQDWRNAPSEQSQLVRNLCCSAEYCAVWEPLACQYWRRAPMHMFAPTQPVVSKDERVLLLSQQVISHICKQHGSAAAGDSQGFSSVSKVSEQCVSRTEGNRDWLEGQIREVMSTSLALVNILFRWWATSANSILRSQDKKDVRTFVLKVAKEMLSDSQHLRKIVNPKHPDVLQMLVFRPSGDDGHHATCTDMDLWKWLGPVLFDALKQGDKTIAMEIYYLVASLRADAQNSGPYQVDPAVFQGFFGERTTETIQLLDDMSGRLEGDDRKRVSVMVESAKKSVQMPSAIESQGE